MQKEDPAPTQSAKQAQQEPQAEKSEIATEAAKSVEWKLREMGFEQHLIKEALVITDDYDKAVEYIIGSIEKAEKEVMKEDEEGQFQDVEQDYKMLFIVRMDLGMGLGKIAAQVGHATLKGYKQMEQRAESSELDEVTFFEWMQSGQKKIVVKAQTEQELLTVLNKAKEAKLNTCYIRDAGLTQIAAGSITVGAIGPAASSELDPITKHLKLL